MSSDNFKILLRHPDGQVTVLEMNVDETSGRFLKGHIPQNLTITESLVIDLIHASLFKVNRRNLLEFDIHFHTVEVYFQSVCLSTKKEDGLALRNQPVFVEEKTDLRLGT